MTEPRELLPELQAWNNGRGITALDWLYMEGRSDFAVAFADLFWPTFMAFEEYVFRSDFSKIGLRDWKSVGASRQSIEGALNNLSLVDMFVPNSEPWSELVEERAIYLGGILADIYRLKLARDFPDRAFVVEFLDGRTPETAGGEVSLSFWQI